MVNFDMVDKMDIILDIIGYEYKDKICAVSYINSDSIHFVTECGIIYRVKFIQKISRLNTSKLDKAIVIYNPDYLIMNLNTLSLLTKANQDNIDEYPINKSAYYHSYKKKPIAICEFLETGKIELAMSLVVSV